MLIIHHRHHRQHLALMRNLLKQFPVEAQHDIDQQRCEERMADRANSCCPGPELLKSIRKISAS